MTSISSSSSSSVKGVKSIKIQPSAIFSIFEQFQRRSELCSGRLIGAIFGTRNEDGDGKVTVSQAFPIPHSEINDQVNINSEYYKNSAELLKTCYGRSQYVLGWYSIALKESIVNIINASSSSAENFEITTSFIHDVFSKEVMKNSPVSTADSAIHLEIMIEDVEKWSVKYSALLAGSEKKGNRYEFVTLPENQCAVEYSKEETFVARSLMHSIKKDNLIGSEHSAVVATFPSAKEFNEASLKEFSEMITKLREMSSTSTSDEASSSALLLKHLPEASAYKKQADKLKNDLHGMHEMVKFLCDQLRESQKLFLSPPTN